MAVERAWPLSGHGRCAAMSETRRYSIEVKDLETRKAVLFTVVDWNDQAKRVALAQIMRGAGAPDDSHFLDMISPEPKRGKD